MITQERLKQLVQYNQETGVFIWVDGNGLGRVKDEVAGAMNNMYLCLNIDGDSYSLHRLAFLYMTGTLPLEEIDHINRIKTDNRWCNLRACSRSENQRNKSAAVNNTLGVKGLNLQERKGRKPKFRGQVAYSAFVNNPDGSREWRIHKLTFSRSFTEGNERTKLDALAEVTEWLRVTREKYHGEFACQE